MFRIFMMENFIVSDTSRKGNSILTYTGIYFWPLDPKISEINIQDIAHALSRICRFNGHIEGFYSVAQHCVLCSWLCSEENKLYGLLHDSAEAYCCDLPSPIKINLKKYKKMENRILAKICKKYDLPLIEPPEVKYWDYVLRATEMRDLRKFNPIQSQYVPLELKIVPWTIEESKNMFLKEFSRLS